MQTRENFSPTAATPSSNRQAIYVNYSITAVEQIYARMLELSLRNIKPKRIKYSDDDVNVLFHGIHLVYVFKFFKSLRKRLKFNYVVHAN